MAIKEVPLGLYEGKREFSREELPPLGLQYCRRAKGFIKPSKWMEIYYFRPRKRVVKPVAGEDITTRFFELILTPKEVELFRVILEKGFRELLEKRIYVFQFRKLLERMQIDPYYKLIEEKKRVTKSEVMTFEEKINNILERVSKGIFTLEDAKEFAEKISPFIERKIELNELSLESDLVKRYERLSEIYLKNFYWITGTLEALLILGILYEENKSYTEQELKKKILELDPYIHPLSLKAELEILEKHGYVKQKKIFLKKPAYVLTKKGEITMTLVKNIYEKVYERIIRKYHK